MANALTILRVALIPLFVYLKLSSVAGHDLLAAAVFGVAALTDLFDGMLARRTGTVTQFGKIIDPLADRVLILTVLVVLVMLGAVPLWAVVVVASRDFAMVFGYKVAQAKGFTPEVSLLGKISTTALMLSIVLLILSAPGAVAAFYVATALSVVSGAQYARDVIGEMSSTGAREAQAGPSRGDG